MEIEDIKKMVDSLPSNVKAQLAQEMQQGISIPQLDAYNAMREATMAFNTKLFEAVGDDLDEFSLLLGLRKSNADKKLLLNEEIEFDYMTDFAIHDYRNAEGKTIIQRYREQNEHLPPFEEETLTIKQAGKTGLFAVTSTNFIEATVTLSNVLNKAAAPVTLTDRGLSFSLQPKHHLIFTRVLHYPEFNVSSGMAMVFTQRKYDKLHKAFEKHYKKLPANLSAAEKRFITFFHLNREFGQPIKMQ